MINLAEEHFNINYSISGTENVNAAISTIDSLDGVLLEENINDELINVDEILFLNAKLIQEEDINTSLQSPEEFSCTIGEAISIDIGDADSYNGDYRVVSKPFEDYKLPTKYKLLTADIVVKKIPTYEVSNESGTTINIGG